MWCGDFLRQLGAFLTGHEEQNKSFPPSDLRDLVFSPVAIPRLRHLRVSNAGNLMTMQPYRKLIFTLPLLEALEIAEVAVWEHIDLSTHLVGLVGMRLTGRKSFLRVRGGPIVWQYGST